MMNQRHWFNPASDSSEQTNGIWVKYVAQKWLHYQVLVDSCSPDFSVFMKAMSPWDSISLNQSWWCLSCWFLLWQFLEWSKQIHTFLCLQRPGLNTTPWLETNDLHFRHVYFVKLLHTMQMPSIFLHNSQWSFAFTQGVAYDV